MPTDTSFQLGPFLVRGDGRLTLSSEGNAPRFHLFWRGCRVDAQILPERAGPGAVAGLGEMQLRATVGRVPSTALCEREAEAGRREEVFAALRFLPARLPPGWTVSLLADHRVAVLSAAKLAMPTTVTALLTDVTMFLLVLAPYLDLLDEVGVEGAAGMVNTWPG